MSGDADLALQGAVLARLKADAGVAAVLGGRAYDQPPAERIYPYLLIGRSETRPFGGTGGEGLEHALTLTVASMFGGSEEAKAVCAAVRACLHNAELGLEAHRLVNLRVTYCDVFKAADWRFTYGVARLRAVTEPMVLEG
ncbi:MAG TPA: DUF3168 domain-containing protein [Caulobacteraceae bacterium]|jgi:hypothetical protein